jgi:NADH:ubiquinone oxidoreductase subunit
MSETTNNNTNETTAANQQGQQGTEEAQTNEQVTVSSEELQKMIDSSADKRVTQALKTAREKWEAEVTEKIQKERTEAEKLAKMTEAERLQAEFDKQKQSFEDERKSFLKEKLELQTVKTLQSEELPAEFSGFVMSDSAEQISENIKLFKEQWQKAIEKAVDERLKGSTPKGSNTNTTIKAEEFAKMNYAERMAIYSQDPELYRRLNGRQ